MTDFTSEGPARVTNDLKPDVSAPGFDIQSTDAGTGDLGTQALRDLDGGPARLRRGDAPPGAASRLVARADQGGDHEPVDAEAEGQPARRARLGDRHGRRTGSGARPRPRRTRWPSPRASRTGSRPSRGRRARCRRSTSATSTTSRTATPSAVAGRATRTSARARRGSRSRSTAAASASSRSFNLPGALGEEGVRCASISTPRRSRNSSRSSAGTTSTRTSTATCVIDESGGGSTDRLHVPWHVAPLAASANGLSKSALDLTGGSDTMRMTSSGRPRAAPYGDLYLLGGVDGLESHGEEDLVAVGARSFTGADPRDGVPEGVPDGHRRVRRHQLAGLPRRSRRAGRSGRVRRPDRGRPQHHRDARGRRARRPPRRRRLRRRRRGHPGRLPGRQAGGRRVARSACSTSRSPTRSTIARRRTSPTTRTTTRTSSGSWSAPRTSASTNNNARLAYQVTACTGTFTGDVPGQFCDTAGDVDPSTGIYTARLNASRPGARHRPARLPRLLGRRRVQRGRSDRGLDRIRRAGRRPEHPGAVPEQRAVAQPDGGDHEHRAVGT